MSDQSTLSRRTILAGSTAFAATLAGAPAFAKGPMLGIQAPYFYRFKVGDAEATIVSDGTLPLGKPEENFEGLTKDEMARQLSTNFLPMDNAVLEQNALIVNMGERTILFDTGMGQMKNFGPTTGKLMNSVTQAGIDPASVDAVVMSHAHIDHCGGNMNAEGKQNFPNAQYYIMQSDYDYWTDENKVPKAFGDFLVQAKRNLTPNRDRMDFFKDGEEFLPGIHAIHAPGHTVGHTIFIIESAGQATRLYRRPHASPGLLLEKPLTEFKYDTDPKQSAQSRVKNLTMLAEKRIPLVAYHFAWPGLGHVAKQGDGFRYYPAG